MKNNNRSVASVLLSQVARALLAVHVIVGIVVLGLATYSAVTDAESINSILSGGAPFAAGMLLSSSPWAVLLMLCEIADDVRLSAKIHVEQLRSSRETKGQVGVVKSTKTMHG